MPPQLPVNTAICSFGMSGRIFHGPFLKTNPGYLVSAIWERSKNESVHMFPDARIYRNLEDLLCDKSIELVIVNTPNATHFDIARAALEADKHVVVEKPFTITVAEGLALQSLAREKGKILAVYHNRRFDSDYKTIRKVLAEEVLGEVVEAEMRFDRYRLHPGSKTHKETPGPGTGNLYDLGSHLIDQALQLFGVPERLFADVAILREESQVDDYFELILFYERLRVRIHASYLVAGELPGYVIHGSLGSFIKPKTNHQEERLTAGEMPGGKDWGIEPSTDAGVLYLARDGKIVEKRVDSETGTYADFYDQLYSAIRQGTPSPVSTEDAIRVIQLIELAYESSREKKVMPVPRLF